MGSKKNLTLYKSLVKSATGKSGDLITRGDMANYFLSNGIDLKGQGQVGIVAKGYGLKVDLSLAFGLASLEVNASADRLTQSVVIVVGGPPMTGDMTVLESIGLFCMTGVKWNGALGASFSAGLSAEASYGVEDGEAKAEAKHSLQAEETEGEDEDEDYAAEAVGVGVSASLGFTADTSLSGEHYWGYDPAPSYYDRSTVDELKSVLGGVLDDEKLKRVLKREAIKLLNSVRAPLVELAAAEKKKNGRPRAEFDSVKKALGVYCDYFRYSLEKEELFSDVRHDKMAAESFFGLLERLAAATLDPSGLPNIPVTHEVLMKAVFGTSVNLQIVHRRATALLERFKPFVTKSSSPRNWLRIRSFSAGFAAEATGEAKVTANASFGKLTASGEASAKVTLAGADGSYTRTGVLWQSTFVSDKGAIRCTHDTAISYWSLSGKVLEVQVAAEARAGKKKVSADASANAAEGGLNLMRYRSAILYWHEHEDERKALPGSGIVYGQSFVIKNLTKAIDTSTVKKVPTRWIVRMAQRLRITPTQMMAFLSSPEVKDMLDDLKSTSQDPGDGSKQGWGDRAVLVESAFRPLDLSQVNFTVDDQVPAGFSAALAKQRGELQSIRLRFRIADHVSSEKKWRLGFKVFGTGAGVTLRSVAEAGAEGIVDLAVKWFGELDGEAAYNRADTVPPAVLFCQ